MSKAGDQPKVDERAATIPPPPSKVVLRRLEALRESRRNDLNRAVDLHGEVLKRIEAASKILREALVMSLELDRRCGQGFNRSVNLARRLGVQAALRTTSAAVRQLGRLVATARVAARSQSEEVLDQIESGGPAFE